MENYINNPLKSVFRDDLDFSKNRRIMQIRSRERHHLISPQQKRMRDIIRGICKSLGFAKIQVEKLVYCKNSGRFYLLDIYIPDIRLDVEIDGNFHDNQKQRDQKRSDNLMESWGIITIRFKNMEIEKDDIKSSIERIIYEQKGKDIRPLIRDLSIPM